MFVEHGGEAAHLRHDRGVSDKPSWSVTAGGELSPEASLIAEALLDFTCEFEAQRAAPKPERAPDGAVRLSRSHGDTRRGTQAIVWWAATQGTLVAAEGAEQAYEADVDLQSNVQRLLAAAATTR